MSTTIIRRSHKLSKSIAVISSFALTFQLGISHHALPFKSLSPISFVAAFSIATKSTTTNTSPIVAPRFDVFSEQLVRSWSVDNESKEIEQSSSSSFAVEEVMRSCGGAVQGIREQILNDNNIDDDEDDDDDMQGLYLNRANDGFVYFDSGTYSFGPTMLSQFLTEEAVCDEKQQVVANFMLGSKRRILLSSTLQPSFFLDEMKSPTPETTTSIYILKSTFGSDQVPSIVSIEQTESQEVESVDCIENSIILSQCSMPQGTMQGWNLQRAKWTKSTLSAQSDVTTEQNKISSSSLEESTRLSYWSSCYEDKSSDSSINSKIIKYQMGIRCEDSGISQCLTRTYENTSVIDDDCDDGIREYGLTSVVWSQSVVVKE